MDEILNRLKQMSVGKIQLRQWATEKKNRVLIELGQSLIESKEAILDANRRDVEAYRSSQGFQSAFLDRLTLTEKRIEQMAESLNVVAHLPDPIGEVVDAGQLPNGLQISRVRSPLGVIFLIFEARPNVTTEAFSLAFKAGNALILKGGKESDRTCRVIYDLILAALKRESLDTGFFWGITEAPREMTDLLLKQNQWIDVLIPRGGDKLIEHVTHHSTIPIIKNDRGLCHLYVHAKADSEMALAILDNAKTQRPSVCNSVETLLVDESIASAFLPKVIEKLGAKQVQFYVCENTWTLLGNLSGVHPVTPKSFDTEYLDLKLSIKIVKGIEEALVHIEAHGSRHSEAIITADESVARQFQLGVDAAAVYWNASTRFTDGGQLGLGAEIGISTQKLHVRGPVGLEALTSIRWIIDGDGQTRPS